MSRPGRETRAVRQIQRPWVSALLLAAILASALLLPTERRGGSFVGSFAGRIAGNTTPLTYPLATAYAFRADGPIRVIDPDRESADELTRLAARTASVDAIVLELFATSNRSGFWAPTRELRSVRIEIGRVPGCRFTEPELREARRLFVEALERGGRLHAEEAAPLRETNLFSRRTLWPGVWHDAATLLLLALLALSLGWVPRWRAMRRERLLRRGLCPRCRYDIRNIQSPRCPECGSPLTTPNDESTALDQPDTPINSP